MEPQEENVFSCDIFWGQTSHKRIPDLLIVLMIQVEINVTKKHDATTAHYQLCAVTIIVLYCLMIVAVKTSKIKDNEMLKQNFKNNC
jgi:hypothetical protein